MGRRRRHWDAWHSHRSPAKARPAKNGIQARSRRGDIGETWWSRRFVEALEAFTEPKRLRRGRHYARSGQVMGLRIEPGLVTSSVQGSRRTPYEVSIAFDPLSDEDWARAERAMTEQAVFLASLLAGEMPRDIEDAFEACDVGLFPIHSRQLLTHCSCPDWANPCKHIAATYYILAERFDDDPFLIMAWRGRDRDSLIEELRANRVVGGGTAPSASPSETSPPALGDPLSIDPARFWRADAAMESLQFDLVEPDTSGAVLREVGPPPTDLVSLDLLERLEPAYTWISVGAFARVGGDAEEDSQ